jgi:hypothetical protein
MKKLIIVLIAMIGFGFAAKAQSVEIYNVEPKEDGKIEVTVKVFDRDSRETYRVKVTPVEWKQGAVVESCKYVEISGIHSPEGKVTFNCTETKKDGDAAMCRTYDFKAELVRD